MSHKLGFGLKSRLRCRPLDTGYPQIANHTAPHTDRSDNTRMNKLALGRPAYERPPIAPDSKGSSAHCKPCLPEGCELCILRVEHGREHRISLHTHLHCANKFKSSGGVGCGSNGLQRVILIHENVKGFI